MRSARGHLDSAPQAALRPLSSVFSAKLGDRHLEACAPGALLGDTRNLAGRRVVFRVSPVWGPCPRRLPSSRPHPGPFASGWSTPPPTRGSRNQSFRRLSDNQEVSSQQSAWGHGHGSCLGGGGCSPRKGAEPSGGHSLALEAERPAVANPLPHDPHARETGARLFFSCPPSFPDFWESPSLPRDSGGTVS